MSKTWEDALKGYVIVSAAIVDDTTFIFGANWDETYHGETPLSEIYDRLVYCDLRAASWGGKRYDNGFSFARAAGGRTADNQKQGLFAAAGGYVTSFVFPGGPMGLEGEMPLRAVANLFFVGEHFYAYGLGRGFMRREGPGDWTILSNDEADNAGPITAARGFAENDIYLWDSGPTGRNPKDKIGQLLHWNGASFSAIPLPRALSENIPWSPFRAHDICCAPDGRVFISGRNGELISGNREIGFSILAPQVERALPGMNLAWFKGKLYGAIDAGLFSFNFDESRWVGEPFAGDPNAPVNFPYIDANENVMLLAGGYGAAIFDGESWIRIAGDVSALDMTRLQLMERQVQDIATLRDIMRDLVEAQKGE